MHPDNQHACGRERVQSSDIGVCVDTRSLELERGLLEERIAVLMARSQDCSSTSVAAEDSITPRAADAIRSLRQEVEQLGQQLEASAAHHILHLPHTFGPSRKEKLQQQIFSRHLLPSIHPSTSEILPQRNTIRIH